MTESEHCGVIAYTLPPAPDRPTGVTARCRLPPRTNSPFTGHAFVPPKERP